MQVTKYFFVVHSSHVWLQKWIKGKISEGIVGAGQWMQNHVERIDAGSQIVTVNMSANRRSIPLEGKHAPG